MRCAKSLDSSMMRTGSLFWSFRFCENICRTGTGNFILLYDLSVSIRKIYEIRKAQMRRTKNMYVVSDWNRCILRSFQFAKR